MIHLEELDHCLMFHESVVIHVETTKTFRNESAEPTRTPQTSASAHLLMNYVIFEQGVEASRHVTLNTPENRSRDTLATQTVSTQLC